MSQTNDLLGQLNESQQRAVQYCDGASLVIAGAGSGKTRVLTYKIAYLIEEKGLKPWTILALTFTNKAAEEMKQRIGRIVGAECAAHLNMGTFHSVFARILRVEAEHIGYRSNYTIYDETDSRTLLKNIIRELNLDDTKYKPAAVGHIISLAKNRLIGAEQYAEDAAALERDRSAGMPALHQIYTLYAQRCRLANAMDFDDLLLNAYILFGQNEDIRVKYVQRYEYVLVDEYQDTNYAQQQIIYQLTRERQRVCVVGDDAQSIYAFRGVNIDNILGFQQLYDNTQLFKLERNYRSTQRIVNAANSLIRHNERQIHKDVYSRNDEGEPLIYQPLYSDKEETVVVSKHIKRIKKEEGGTYSDFAILYRTNSQSRAFEEQLRKDGIPYRIFGGLSFYQHKEIKDVIAYFRLTVNPDDEEALRRVINYPARGIGNVTVGKIVDAAHRHGISVWSAITTMTPAELSLTAATMKKIQGFTDLITSFTTRLASDDAYTLGYDIIKSSGIAQELLSDTSPEGMARKENLDELLNGLKDFVELRREEAGAGTSLLTDYLQEVSLLTDLDGGDEEAESEEGRVALMTVHGAKGLEFPTVFIVGLEENIFPSPLSTNTARELEEERRLLYVAITRAERHCFLTSVQNRLRYGRMEFNPRSRFINDIDQRYMRVSGGSASDVGRGAWHTRASSRDWMQNSHPVGTQFKADPRAREVPPRQPEKTVDPLSVQFRQLLQQESVASSRRKEPAIVSRPSQVSQSSAPHGLREGCTVEHQRFGIGTVVRLEGRGENLKATVAFKNAGQKQLLVKFAKLIVKE